MSSLERWIQSLNTAQKQVVYDAEGVVIVYAGAGSGKTRTLTLRIAYLLSKGVQPYEILGVTFTNKAAQELTHRVRDLVGSSADHMLISTFHGLCTYLFRIHQEPLKVKPNFLIYTDQDQIREMKLIIRSMGTGSSDFKAEQLVAYLNDLRSKGVSFLKPHSFQALSQLPIRTHQQEVVFRYFQKYEEILHQKNAYDFGRLLTFLLESLKENQEYAYKLAQRFRYIFVDEFQDTNMVQMELIRELAQVHRSLCVVGDDDQSIYSWRGAEPQCFENLKKWYPECRTIQLTVNYRSVSEILRYSNALIAHNVNRHPKELSAHRTDRGAVHLLEARHRLDEAFWVAKKIRELKQQHPLWSYRDFAILFRVNSLARFFEQACVMWEIPYQLQSGLKIFDFYENSLLLSYLRVLHNPLDTTAFLETLSFPRKGWGDKSLTVLQQFQESTAQPILILAEQIANGVLTLPVRITKSALIALQQHLQLFKKLSSYMEEHPSLHGLLVYLLKETQFEEALRKAYSQDVTRRWSNVLLLLEIAQQFDQQYSGQLGLFLNQQALHGADDKEEQEAVQLMTIHAAKGLEFRCVFLVGLEEGVLPLKWRPQSDRSEEAHAEEERRLCYVAMTRAKDQLFLSYTQLDETNLEQPVRQPSVFLKNIATSVGLPSLEWTPEAFRYSKAGRQWPAYRSSFSSSQEEERQERSSYSKIPLVQTADRLEEKRSSHTLLSEWRAGERVKHSLFGIGHVLTVQGAGPNQKLVIRFPKGEKIVLSRFVEKINS